MLDQLLLLFMLLFALFLRYMLSLLGDWQQPREQEGLPTGKQTTPSLPPVVTPVPLPSIPKVPSSRVAGQATALPAVSTVIPRGRRRWQRFHGHEARRGIVLMTILGPCRALEEIKPPH